MKRRPATTKTFDAAGRTELQTWVTSRDFTNEPKKRQFSNVNTGFQIYTITSLYFHNP